LQDAAFLKAAIRVFKSMLELDPFLQLPNWLIRLMNAPQGLLVPDLPQMLHYSTVWRSHVMQLAVQLEQSLLLLRRQSPAEKDDPFVCQVADFIFGVLSASYYHPAHIFLTPVEVPLFSGLVAAFAREGLVFEGHGSLYTLPGCHVVDRDLLIYPTNGGKAVADLLHSVVKIFASYGVLIQEAFKEIRLEQEHRSVWCLNKLLIRGLPFPLDIILTPEILSGEARAIFTARSRLYSLSAVTFDFSSSCLKASPRVAAATQGKLRVLRINHNPSDQFPHDQVLSILRNSRWFRLYLKILFKIELARAGMIQSMSHFPFHMKGLQSQLASLPVLDPLLETLPDRIRMKNWPSAEDKAIRDAIRIEVGSFLASVRDQRGLFYPNAIDLLIRIGCLEYLPVAETPGTATVFATHAHFHPRPPLPIPRRRSAAIPIVAPSGTENGNIKSDAELKHTAVAIVSEEQSFEPGAA
jgi:hypothetical protein